MRRPSGTPGVVPVASRVYAGLPASTAYGRHRAGEPESRRGCEGMNDLTAGFGVALLDQAVIDATCRLAGRTFHQGLREDLFGFGPLAVPPRPLGTILVRHTVGLSDPITRSDVARSVQDGLPEALEDVIRTYGVRWFKVKISGDADGTLERLGGSPRSSGNTG